MMRLTLAMLLSLALIVGCRASQGAERLRVVGPPPADEAARDLMESVASACNRRQFTDFMSHFTARQAASIRGRMENLFTQTDVTMEVMEVIVLSHSNERIVFGVRYAWNDKVGPRRIFASKVTAVKVHDSWKVDREQVQSKREQASTAATARDQRFDFGGGGAVVLNPSDDFLPLDIPRRPGGCANGKCGL